MSAADQPADRALREGLALLEHGRTLDAARAFTRAIASDPQSLAAYLHLSLAEIKLSHHQQARAAAQQALAIDPASEWGHRLLAISLLKLNKNKEARQAAQRAVELAPDGHHGYIVLADALLAVGDLAGAQAAATCAVGLAPGDSATHSTVSQVKLRQENWAAAEHAARQALAISPDNPVALNNLAVALRRRRRPAEAVNAFEQAARLDPHNPTIRRNVQSLRRSPSTAMHISPQTDALIDDDRRARRYQPARWDWARLKRLRPWWWLLLARIPRPLAFTLTLGLFLLLLTEARNGHPNLWGWTIIVGLTIPFTARRAITWWRIRHPPRSSWRPPDNHA